MRLLTGQPMDLALAARNYLAETEQAGAKVYVSNLVVLHARPVKIVLHQPSVSNTIATMSDSNDPNDAIAKAIAHLAQVVGRRIGELTTAVQELSGHVKVIAEGHPEGLSPIDLLIHRLETGTAGIKEEIHSAAEAISQVALNLEEMAEDKHK